MWELRKVHSTALHGQTPGDWLQVFPAWQNSSHVIAHCWHLSSSLLLGDCREMLDNCIACVLAATWAEKAQACMNGASWQAPALQ